MLREEIWASIGSKDQSSFGENIGGGRRSGHNGDAKHAVFNRYPVARIDKVVGKAIAVADPPAAFDRP